MVFVWSKGALEAGGALHDDFLKSCRSKVADGALANAADGDAEACLSTLWNILVKGNCYREWLSHKCSGRRQAAQGKFASERCAVSTNLCYATID